MFLFCCCWIKVVSLILCYVFLSGADLERGREDRKKISSRGVWVSHSWTWKIWKFKLINRNLVENQLCYRNKESIDLQLYCGNLREKSIFQRVGKTFLYNWDVQHMLLSVYILMVFDFHNSICEIGIAYYGHYLLIIKWLDFDIFLKMH